MPLADDLHAARTAARERADLLVRAAADEERDLTADEMSQYSDAIGEEREAQDRIEQLRDREVAELRAAQVRSTETRPGLGEMLMRTVTEASGLGAAVTPPEFSASFFDRLAATAVFLQAGAPVVTTDRDSLTVPRVISDTTAGWVSEGNSITSTDANADTVTATPRKLAGLQPVTNETLADSSPSVGEMIVAGLVRSIALELDRAFFFGSGAAPEIRGLANTANIQYVTAGAPDFDDIVDGIELLQTANATPTALFLSPRAWSDLLRVKELTSGSNKPALLPSSGSVSDGFQQSVFGIPVYVSGVLSWDPNLAYLVDMPRAVTVVRRQDTTVEIDSSRLFHQDTSEIRAITRVDLVVQQPRAVVEFSQVS
jgi:HK97 family phage major capsid protein